MMRYIIIGVVAVVVIGMGLAIWLRSRIDQRSGGIGFREYVRDPELRSQMGKTFAQREQAVAELTQQPPADLVRMLLDDDLHDLVKRAICQVGPVVVPSLIAAVKEPQYRRRIDEKTQESMHVLIRRSEPLETVLECLQHYAPESAVASISALVEDDSDEIRKHAALLLGTIGSSSAVDAVCRSLADEDDYVRSYAMMGILRAIDAGRVTDGFRTAVFSAVEPLVFRRDATVSGDAPRCLLGLDRQRAISVLTAEDSLVAGRDGLQDVLQALREASVAVDSAQLLALVSRLEVVATEYPNDYALGEALRSLATVNSDAARAAIARGMDSPSQRVREDATEALAASYGIIKPFDFAWERLNGAGWSGLTESQRHVFAVRIFIDEVNNGGFSQYFVNSSGDHWREALAGLEAIGAQSALALMRQATSRFGTEGPGTAGDERHHQLARLTKTDEELFAPLEKMFYKDEADREVLLLRYIIDHAEDFRSE